VTKYAQKVTKHAQKVTKYAQKVTKYAQKVTKYPQKRPISPSSFHLIGRCTVVTKTYRAVSVGNLKSVLW
jgi:hypothetical protein